MDHRKGSLVSGTMTETQDPNKLHAQIGVRFFTGTSEEENSAQETSETEQTQTGQKRGEKSLHHLTKMAKKMKSWGQKEGSLTQLARTGAASRLQRPPAALGEAKRT